MQGDSFLCILSHILHSLTSGILGPVVDQTGAPLDVTVSVTFLSKGRVANVTLVGPLAKVCANVILHVGELVESFMANIAGKLLV